MAETVKMYPLISTAGFIGLIFLHGNTMSNTKISKPITLESIAQSIEKLPTREEMNDSIDELARMVAVGFKETNGMVYGLQKDVNGLKTDVGILKTDVNTLKTDVNGLRGDVKGLRTDFNDLEDTVTANHGHRLRRIESKLQLA